MAVTLDWSQSDGTKFPLLDDGTYEAKLSDIIEKTSSTGGPMLEFTYEVKLDKGKKQKLWDRPSLQPQALFRLKKTLIAMGFEADPTSFKKSTDLLNAIKKALKGKSFYLDVVKVPYKDGETNNITGWSPSEFSDSDGGEGEDGETAHTGDEDGPLW